MKPDRSASPRSPLVTLTMMPVTTPMLSSSIARAKRGAKMRASRPLQRTCRFRHPRHDPLHALMRGLPCGLQNTPSINGVPAALKPAAGHLVRICARGNGRQATDRRMPGNVGKETAGRHRPHEIEGSSGDGSNEPSSEGKAEIAAR